MGTIIKWTLIISAIILALIFIPYFFAMASNSGTNENQSKGYQIIVMEDSLYSDFTMAKAISATTHNENEVINGTRYLSHGIKTIDGIKVYYDTYTDLSSYDPLHGTLFFKKNNSWHCIHWSDSDVNNSHKSAIDKEISDKINNI